MRKRMRKSPAVSGLVAATVACVAVVFKKLKFHLKTTLNDRL